MGCERLNGVPEYWCWEKVPTGLKTKTTWRKEGRKVRPDAEPLGQKLVMKGARGAWPLYSFDQTVAVRSGAKTLSDEEMNMNNVEAVRLDITPNWFTAKPNDPRLAFKNALEARLGQAWLLERGDVLQCFWPDFKIFFAALPEGTILLDLIWLSAEHRGKGQGSVLLANVCEAADLLGVRLRLTVKTMAPTRGHLKEPCLNKAALTRWYKRHGFKKDGGYMVRQPLSNLDTCLKSGGVTTGSMQRISVQNAERGAEP